MSPLSRIPRLIALSPGTLASEPLAPFLARLERALAEGLCGFLLREPGLGDRAYLELGRTIGRLREAHAGLWFAVHDRAHLAAELGADAVHLSSRSLAPLDVRPWLPPTVALGLSTHAGDDPARWSEADYVFHGPLRAPRSKPGAVALGFEGLARAHAASERPVLALGGVLASDGPELRHLGLHGAAVLSGWQAEEGSVRAYLAGLP